MLSKDINRRKGIGSAKSLMTISLVTSVTLVTMVLVLAWGRTRHNDAADTEDGRALQAAAAQELGRQTIELKRLAREAPRAGLWPDSLGSNSFTHIFLIDINKNAAMAGLPQFGRGDAWAPFAPLLKSAVDALRSDPRPLLRGALDEPGASVALESQTPAETAEGYIVERDSGFAASILRLTDPAAALQGSERALALVGLRRLDQDFLNRVALTAGIGALGVVSSPSGDPSLASVAIAGENSAAWLEWRADRPGDRLVGQIGSMLVSFAALFAGLLAWRTTTGLADSESDAKRLAGHDLLSGLPNRLLFSDILDTELERAAREGTSLGLFYIDLDRFKEINDSFGHDAGDRVIVAVAKRMQETVRATDTVARFGGDEFAILQPNVKSLHDSEQLARRLLAALREPFDLGSDQVRVGASIGVTVGPRDATDRDALMRCADLALYRAKAAGRNRYMVFDNGMIAQHEQRKTTEQELRLAIERNELVVYYQPIVSLDGRTLVAVEALVRWNHPDRGMIPPGEFISLAESRGLILPLGEFVLRQACKDAADFGSIRVAVNVSAIQFRHRNFVQTVERALAETGLDPARLELELTEGVVVDDADEAETAMIDLRAMGVRLALDDFGTGYSSLIYLRRFAFDKIKIDRSFLEAVESTGESAIIVHSVVHLGRALGLTVTAEGIETTEQHRFLQALGAHELQGYMFSRPVPAANIIAICRNNCVMPPAVPVVQNGDGDDSEKPKLAPPSAAAAA